MKSQMGVEATTILDRIRTYNGSIEVIKGTGFNQHLVRLLEIPDVSASELAIAVDRLVDDGHLSSEEVSRDLGKGGVASEQVFQVFIKFTLT